jgi:hypothetical protein
MARERNGYNIELKELGLDIQEFGYKLEGANIPGEQIRFNGRLVFSFWNFRPCIGESISFFKIESDFDRLSGDQVRAILGYATQEDVEDPPDRFVRDIPRELRSDYKAIIHSFDPLQNF